ncbi:MAG: hypothetical protein RLZZ293_1342 [Pseudomonadota bacterium]|jgi:DNA polymerase
MKLSAFDYLANNLWLPRVDKIEELQQKYDLPRPANSQLDWTSVSPELSITPIVINLPSLPQAEKPKLSLSLEQATAKLHLSLKSTQAIAQSQSLLNPVAKSIHVTTTEDISTWQLLEQAVESCELCKLCQGRKNSVLERGNRLAKWMFIGEAPGEQEDLEGKPFVGAAGELLERMIKAMNLNSQQDIYIANVIKCRPPHNRNPYPDEVATCQQYLIQQIKLVQPKIIITLGRFASQTLLNTTQAVAKLRGKVFHYEHIPVVVTYHPAYLLRYTSEKGKTWQDLQLAMQIMSSN